MPTYLNREIGARVGLFLVCCFVATLAGCASDKSCCVTKSPSAGVRMTEVSNVVRVEINGELFTDYHFADAPRPYFYPVIGPEASPMTRNWPMESPQGEEHDHPHHRSLWYGHGSVNGIDFWAETNGIGKIVHDGFMEIKSGAGSGVIKSKDKWLAPDGSVVCTDDRVFRVYNVTNGRLFDFEITLHASNGKVTFNDTKEGSMAMRLAESMRLKPSTGNQGSAPLFYQWHFNGANSNATFTVSVQNSGDQTGHGHIVTSEGARDEDTWGKHGEWCDYYGPVNGKIVGVAIFDNPSNPRHPTTWHVRDYGLFAANPFGLHDFEKQAKGAGDFTIPAGESATFKYRFYIHEGDEKQSDVAGMYRRYVAGGTN